MEFTMDDTYPIQQRYSAVAEAEAKAMLEAGRRAKEREQRRKERRERMEAVTSALNAEIDRKRDQRSQISRVDYHKSIPAPTRVPTQISEREVVGDSVKAVEAEGESTCNEESATPATEKHVPETTTSKVESPVQETENGYDVNTAQEEEEEELELTEAEDAGKAEVESEVEAEAEIDAKSNENPFEVSSMAEESNEESGSELSETCADEEADTDIVGEESVEAEQEQVEEKVVQKDEVMTEVKACTEAVEDKEYTLSELQAMMDAATDYDTRSTFRSYVRALKKSGATSMKLPSECDAVINIEQAVSAEVLQEKSEDKTVISQTVEGVMSAEDGSVVDSDPSEVAQCEPSKVQVDSTPAATDSASDSEKEEKEESEEEEEDIIRTETEQTAGVTVDNTAAAVRNEDVTTEVDEPSSEAELCTPTAAVGDATSVSAEGDYAKPVFEEATKHVQEAAEEESTSSQREIAETKEPEHIADANDVREVESKIHEEEEEEQEVEEEDASVYDKSYTLAELETMMDKATEYNERAALRAQIRTMKKSGAATSNMPSEPKKSWNTVQTGSKTSAIIRPSILSQTESFSPQQLRKTGSKGHQISTSASSSPKPAGQGLLRKTMLSEKFLSSESKSLPGSPVSQALLRKTVPKPSGSATHSPSTQHKASAMDSFVLPATSYASMTVSSAAVSSGTCVDWVNQVCGLKIAADNSMALAEACKDGIMLCKMCNAAVKDTIDVRVINTKNLDRVAIEENFMLLENSTRAIGCNISSVNMADVQKGTCPKEVEKLLTLMLVAGVSKRVVFTKRSDKAPPSPKCTDCDTLIANSAGDGSDTYVSFSGEVVCKPCVSKEARMLLIVSGNAMSVNKSTLKNVSMTQRVPTNTSNETSRRVQTSVKPSDNPFKAADRFRAAENGARSVPSSPASVKRNGASDSLLRWCQSRLFGFEGLADVVDFSESWADGMAFCALGVALVGVNKCGYTWEALKKEEKLKNLETAFQAFKNDGVCRMLDAEDMGSKPDKKSVMLYISQIYKLYN